MLKQRLTLLSNRGAILPIMTVILLFLLGIGLTLMGVALNQYRHSQRGLTQANSLLAAEAGIEKSLQELNQDDTFAGYASEQEFFNNDHQGRGTYETTVTNGDINNEKIITSIGRVYTPPSASEPRVTRRVEAVVVGTTATDYSVHTGPGGLIMNNSATIANGDVHVNGFIRMRNSSRIGSESNPGTIEVPHIHCPEPPDETFPQQCGEGEGQPIDIESPAWIYGDVYATNQTDGEYMSHGGLIDGSTAEEVTLPDYDRQAHKDASDAEEDSISHTNASCTQNNTTKTWGTGARITGGDVEISKKCKVFIEGDVWIRDGGLLLRNSGRIEVAAGLEESPTVMIDGVNGFESYNSSAIIANENGVGVDFITFHSDADCSPDCTDVSGVDLYNSQQINTILLNNSGEAAGSTFYARWSKVEVSNSGSMGGVLGQTVELSNSGNISFGEELSSGESVWSIVNYRRVFE